MHYLKKRWFFNIVHHLLAIKVVRAMNLVELTQHTQFRRGSWRLFKKDGDTWDIHSMSIQQGRTSWKDTTRSLQVLSLSKGLEPKTWKQVWSVTGPSPESPFSDKNCSRLKHQSEKLRAILNRPAIQTMVHATPNLVVGHECRVHVCHELR